MKVGFRKNYLIEDIQTLTEIKWRWDLTIKPTYGLTVVERESWQQRHKVVADTDSSVENSLIVKGTH